MIRTPYHAAVQQNLLLSLHPDNPKCKSFLDQCNNLDREIILSTRDRRMEFHNLTLLHIAARMGLTKAIEHLLSVGQEIDIIDTSVSLRTPLLEAIAARQEEAVFMLIKFGAQLSHQDINGENSFHYAAKVGSRMLRVLYSNCDINRANIQKLLSVTNIKLQFPEDRAINSITKDILIELRQYGCRIQKNGKKNSKRKAPKSMIATTDMTSSNDVSAVDNHVS